MADCLEPKQSALYYNARVNAFRHLKRPLIAILLAPPGAFAQDGAPTSRISSATLQFAGGPRILAQVLERIALCAAFKDRQQAALSAFLRRQ